jgi:hypothetical protein
MEIPGQFSAEIDTVFAVSAVLASLQPWSCMLQGPHDVAGPFRIGRNMAEFALAQSYFTVLAINVPTMLIGLKPMD